MLNAIERFEQQSFTQRQVKALATKPWLYALFKGERIDTFFKSFVKEDPRLSHLNITPRFKFGPDVYNAESHVWWDVTTKGQWNAHLVKYSKRYGPGTILDY